MKKICLVGIAGIFLFFTCACMAGEELLTNGGFEETQVMAEKDGFQKILSNAGWKFDEPLVFPMGWKTNSGVKTEKGEFRMITDSSISHAGKNCVFIRGHLSTGKVTEVSGGDKIEVVFYAKDPDKQKAAIHLYLYGMNDKGKQTFAGSIAFNFETEPGWTKKTGTLTIPEKGNNNAKITGATLALSSRTGVYFDDIEATIKKAEQ